MSNFVNIPLGLKLTTQVPLNIKEFAGSEALLKDLGLDNNLAFTYHKDLEVTCLAEGTKWIWREVQIGEENTGLLDTDFTYPPDLIAFGVDYSNKKYNFFSTAVIIPHIPLETITEGINTGIAIRGRTAANYGNIGSKAVDLSNSSNPSSTLGATGAYSFAANDSTTASDYGAVAMGVETVASGESSFAIGSEAIASNLNSVAIGRDVEASGFAANASGFITIASGQSSNARNERTSAQGDFSNAEGYNSDALGKYSHAGGQENTAGSYGETVIGHFATNNFSENPTSIVSTDRLFTIGNGTSDISRSNAFSLLKNGLATLPSVTNALITAGSNKSIITREYLESLSFTDANALHKTGNENWTGQKGGSNLTAGNPTVLQAINNSTIVNGRTVSFISASGSNSELLNLDLQSSLGGIGLCINSTVSSAITPIVNKNNGVNNFTVDKLGNTTANTFVKTGGTSSQYLMADGSVSTGLGIQSVIITGGWATNQGNVVDTTIGTGKTIISITSTLICTTSNNGYAVGDIVNISQTQTNDTGGLTDSGVSIRWRADTSDRFTFNVNDRIDIPNCYNGTVGTSGAITDPVSASPAQWNMRTVIMYI